MIKNWISFTAMSLGCILMLCQCNRSKTTTEDFNDQAVASSNTGDVQDDLNKSKTIIYTLPAPVEVASLIKESGVKYDEDILNDINKASSYDTNLKLALNLGIYTTDMSFANIFNQSQKTIDYLSSLKRLTERLGIVQLVDEETIRKFESQGTSKDEMLGLVSEVYMNANQYLNENNRKNVAVQVMVGGWTEGLYIALNILNGADKGNKQLTERIIAQKLALSTVLTILDSNNPNGADEDLTYLYGKMNEIKVIFDEVKVDQQNQVLAETDANVHLTRIKANIKSDISQEILSALCTKVTEVRNEFVK